MTCRCCVAQELLQGTYVHYVLTQPLSQSHPPPSLFLFLSLPLPLPLCSLISSLSQLIYPISFTPTYTITNPSPSYHISSSHTLTFTPSHTLSPCHTHSLNLLLFSLSPQCGDDESVWGCNRHLTLDSYVAYGGWPFCKPCYTKNFKQGTTYLSAVWCDAVLYWSVLYCTAYFS